MPCPRVETPRSFELRYNGDPLHVAVEKIEANRIIRQTLVYAEGQLPAFSWEMAASGSLTTTPTRERMHTAAEVREETAAADAVSRAGAATDQAEAESAARGEPLMTPTSAEREAVARRARRAAAAI